jgi:hypothetical protein
VKSPDQTTTQRLTAAADLLEKRAAAATPGPWQPQYAYLNHSRVQGVFIECGAQDGCDGVDCIDGTHGIGGFDKDGDNRWAILANPALAEPLARLLREHAAALDAVTTLFGGASPVAGVMADLAEVILAAGGDR